ncbi:MAG: hypothetical protein ACOY9Y_09655 [Bacillota bacterium]
MKNKKQTHNIPGEPLLKTDTDGFIKWFKHWRSGKIIRASDYGYEAFPIKKKKA